MSPWPPYQGNFRTQPYPISSPEAALNQFTRNVLLWSVIAVAMVSLFSMFNDTSVPVGRSTAYSAFVTQVESGEVSKVVIEDRNLTVSTHDGQTYSTYAPNDPSLVQQLKDKNVVIDVKKPEETPLAMSIFVSWFPMLLLIGVWIFFARQQMGGGNKAMSFGRSRARMQDQNQVGKVTFADVAGVDEAKEELAELQI